MPDPVAEYGNRARKKLKLLLIVVFYFFKLSIYNVFIFRLLFAAFCPLSSLCLSLHIGIHFLTKLLSCIGQSLRLCFKSFFVTIFKCFFKLFDSFFYALFLGFFKLVAILFKRLASGVYKCVGLVSGMSKLSYTLIFLGISLSVFNHAFYFFLTKA